MVQKGESCEWKIHRDNSAVHSIQITRQFLAEHGIPQMRRAPSSSDMASCALFLFYYISETSEDKICDMDKTEHNETKQLLVIPKSLVREVLPGFAGIFEQIFICLRSLLSLQVHYLCLHRQSFNPF
jgi:hypothetical protein